MATLTIQVLTKFAGRMCFGFKKVLCFVQFEVCKKMHVQKSQDKYTKILRMAVEVVGG